MANRGQSFTRAARLLTAHDYKEVFDNNQCRASTRYALLLALTHQHPTSRLGLVVAKRHVKLATERNRIKRLVREHFRTQQLSIHSDLIFLARAGIGDLNNQQIRDQLNELWRKLERRMMPV